jgi:hypothetical protein
MFNVRLILSPADSRLRLATGETDSTKDLVPLGPDEAWMRVRKVFQDEGNASQLRSLAAEWTDAGQMRGWDDQELERNFLDWVSRGEVMIVAEPAQALNPGIATRGLELKVDPPPPAQKKKKVAWIAIELVDQDGEPVPDQPYKIELPNGSSRAGNLDSQGKARIEGIDPPGTCKISFPELDAADWKAA